MCERCDADRVAIEMFMARGDEMQTIADLCLHEITRRQFEQYAAHWYTKARIREIQISLRHPKPQL